MYFLQKAFIILFLFLLNFNVNANPQDIIQKLLNDRIKAELSFATKTDNEASFHVLTNDLINKLNALKLPTEDLPDNKIVQKFKNEDSEEFYYGYNDNPDYKKARLIAYSNLASIYDSSEIDIMPSASVLIMLYANGQGVKRNFDLAMMFAIIGNFSSAELELIIQALQNYQSINWEGNDFNFCDYSMSGLMTKYCSNISNKIEAGKRKKLFANITRNWSKKELSEFEKLQEIANDYYEKNISSTTDYSGTIAQTIVISEKTFQQEAFKKIIEQLENNEIQNISFYEFQEADKKLNKIYKILMSQMKENIPNTTIKKADIKEAQRDWIKYRDAFCSFVAVKYSNISANTIRKILIDVRIEEIKDIIANLNLQYSL